MVNGLHNDDPINLARTVEDAVRQLCRATTHRPTMAPAEVDVVLVHLAEAAAALPQAATQIGDILERSQDEYVLSMDHMTDRTDPGLAVSTAQLHLDTVCGLGVNLYRSLSAARNEVAHIAAAERPDERPRADVQQQATRVRRPEDRQPPSMGGGAIGPGLQR